MSRLTRIIFQKQKIYFLHMVENNMLLPFIKFAIIYSDRILKIIVH